MIEVPPLELTETQQRALEKLPARVVEALRRFCDNLLERFPGDIRRIILYGSFARGDAQVESDVDVMVVVGWEFETLPGGWHRSPYSDPRWQAIIRLSVDATNTCERDVAPLVLSEAMFRDKATDAAREARREGIQLYNASTGFTPAGKWLAAPAVAVELLGPSTSRRILREALDHDVEPVDVSDPEAWLALADGGLRVVRDLLRDAHYAQATSRAYYGMFYSAKAALLCVGVSVKSHSGTNSEFGRCFVVTGRVDVQYQALLSQASRDRQRSDYAPKSRPSKSDAERMVRDAEIFIAKARELVKDELSKRGAALT